MAETTTKKTAKKAAKPKAKTVSTTSEFIENINDYTKDRLIFGTDYPFNHFKNYNPFLKLIEKLDLTKEKKNMIMYSNVKKNL